MLTYLSQQRVTKACIPCSGIIGEYMLWIEGRRQVDKLDCYAAAARVYIHIGRTTY